MIQLSSLGSQESVDFKSFSDSALLARFDKLVQTERSITHIVLTCILEIDLRRLYLPEYTSLFAFLVKKHGYSESAADRRISSARLLRQVPQIAEKIETGALTLSQLAQAQQAINLVQKTEARKVGLEEKAQLLAKIENSTQKETELILAQELSLPFQVKDKEQIHRNESVTLTITFSKEQMALLEQAQDLIAHCVPHKKWSEMMVYLAQKEVDRRTKTRRTSLKKEPLPKKFKKETSSKTNASSEPEDLSQTTPDQEKSLPALNQITPEAGIDSITEVNSSSVIETPIVERPIYERKPLSASVRKFVLNRDQCCQFKDPKTGKICGNIRFLQTDHVQSIWAGGTNDPENLQALCAQHNQFKYRMEAGYTH